LKQTFTQSFTVYKSRSFRLFIGIFLCGQGAADFITGLAIYYVDDVLNAYGGGHFTLLMGTLLVAQFDLRSLKLAAIGHTPEGFGFGRAMDQDLLKTFGVHLESVEARELIDTAKSYQDEEILPYLDDVAKRTTGLDRILEKNRKDFARLYKAYDEFIKKNGIGAIASRCWPDFLTAFGTPVCTVLGILNGLRIASSCETDVYGALSMYAGMQLSGKQAFFGDPVSLDEKDNTITFWHCGTCIK
jgi:L-fucose isomerase-like protein